MYSTVNGGGASKRLHGTPYCFEHATLCPCCVFKPVDCGHSSWDKPGSINNLTPAAACGSARGGIGLIFYLHPDVIVNLTSLHMWCN